LISIEKDFRLSSRVGGGGIELSKISAKYGKEK